MQRLVGVVQHYAWGDPAAIPHLLGLPTDGRPWAEWWLGTHPAGPARLVDGTPLVARAGELPMLVKVLAVAAPLSLQTHPDGPTARRGFADEERRGVAIDAPTRIYRDPHAKPELICALSDFDALCGFRPVDRTREVLAEVGATTLAAEIDRAGLAATVAACYRGELDPARVVGEVLTRGGEQPEASLVRDLWTQYPGDPSVAVTLLLHRVRLAPGEALFLGPGNLHAYLRGVGVEVMGASDNVVRGGLTTKYVDVDELLRITRIEPIADPVLRPVQETPGRWRYPTPSAPFVLHRLELDGGAGWTAEADEIVLCTAGDAGALHRGEAAWVPAGSTVVLDAPATVFRVSADSAR